MKKNNLATIALGSALAGDYLGDVMLGRNPKTFYDKRCQEKKIAKRRAKNKRKKLH